MEQKNQNKDEEFLRKKEEAKQKRKKKLEIKAGVVLTFAVLLITFSFYFYQVFFWPNFLVHDEHPEETFIYIPTGADFSTVMDTLNEHRYVNNPPYFAFLSQAMSYQDNVKPGRYRLKKDQNNYEVVKMLRSGNQVPLNVSFNNIRLLPDLAERIGSKIEAEPEDILSKLQDTTYLRELGAQDSTEAKAWFIPNTYEFFWTTSADEFIRRMKTEYDRFWTDERQQKAEKLGLSRKEVSVLASIVEAESRMDPEKPTIAGVYLNRLQRGMKLQADPTVVFANGDFTVRRVTNDMLKYDSPYNTYLYKGLPPGPINLPSTRSIDAVLNAEDHKFLYFVASVDNPGYHDFSRTHSEHSRKANRYRRYLNEQKIYN